MRLIRRLRDAVFRTLVRWELGIREVEEIVEPIERATQPIQAGWGFFRFLRALLRAPLEQ